ncbi:MAG: methyltransferase domain-containing protein [Alphaproteobacteria bacterium]|nr:methyltransferase domain-containing protein [Alphaproteobacteria bacterium]
MEPLNSALQSLAGNFSIQELKNAYGLLSAAYRSGRKITLDTQALCYAYAQARMPATYSVLQKMADHLSQHADSLHSMLDLGCGPGSALWAFSPNIPLKEVKCLDQSKALLQLADQLYQKHENPIPVQWIQQNIQDFIKQKTLDQKFDLTCISYVLNEIPEDMQAELINAAWHTTHQFLLIVEPGTPKGFENIRNTRDILIQKGAHILAPCTHSQLCPMSPNDWCHFSSRLQRSKTHKNIKGTLAYEDEKYSYLIASRHAHESGKARVVKKPNQSSGLVEFETCDSQGLSCQKFSKRQADLYKKAKKIQWGDVWEQP